MMSAMTLCQMPIYLLMFFMGVEFENEPKSGDYVVTGVASILLVFNIYAVVLTFTVSLKKLKKQKIEFLVLRSF